MKPDHFHLNGKGFIHFHDEPDGLWADIFLSKGVLRMPANTTSERADVIGNIEPTLESLESVAKKNTEKSNKSNQVIESWHWE